MDEKKCHWHPIKKAKYLVNNGIDTEQLPACQECANGMKELQKTQYPNANVLLIKEGTQ